MTRLPSFSRAVWPLCALASGACFAYVPAREGLTPKPGSEIRVQMAVPADFQIGEVTIHDVSAVEGNVYQSNGDSLALWSQWLHSRVGKYQGGGAVLFIPRSAVRVLEERRLNARKTGVGLAVTGAVVVLFFELIRRTAGSGGTVPPPGGNPT